MEKIKNLIADLTDKVLSQNIQEIINANDALARELSKLRATNLLFDELILSKSPIIFDIGANVGLLTSSYRKKYPTAIIHAFEPHPEAYKTLCEKFVNDPFVITNNCGVADKSGILQFNIANQSESSSFVTFSNDSPYVNGIGLNTLNTINVGVTSIDNYCKEKNISHIDFIKLDVQGYESKVLLGAVRMFTNKSIHTIQSEIVFRNFYETSSSFYEIEACLVPYGFTLRSIFDIYPGAGAQIFQTDTIYSIV